MTQFCKYPFEASKKRFGVCFVLSVEGWNGGVFSFCVSEVLRDAYLLRLAA